MIYIADAVGLFALMVLVVILQTFVSPANIATPLWIPIYLVWAVCAIFVWHKPAAVWRRWGLIGTLSMGGAVLWYVVTRGIAHMVFAIDESDLSKAIDIAVALILSPGITFIAIAGYVRELSQRKLP